MAEPTKKASAIEEMLTALSGVSRGDTIRANKCIPRPIGKCPLCSYGVDIMIQLRLSVEEDGK
jgi:hypothetical protein